MEFFQSLGRDLDARWRAAGCSEDAFPALAAAILRERNPSASVDPAQILEWLLESDSLPRQDAINVDFPVTLFSCERFSIDALFWVDGTTTIHDHAFWGAFQVLAGSSIHTRYSFTETERVTSYLSRGDLKRHGLELLRRGDVREICVGREFIHALFHLDRPSVSIIVSTRSPLQYASAFSYLSPGFAYVERFEEQCLVRHLGALDLIHRTRPDDYERAVSRYVSRSDAMYTFRALRQAHVLLDEESFARVLEATRSNHPRLTDVWLAAFQEMRRQDNIVARRAIVHDAQHRFFFAVVLNAPRRDDILRLVAERVPDRDPIDTIVKWVGELAAVPIAGPAGPTAIGVPLDEAELRILHALMLGRDVRGVIEMLKETFDDEEIEAQRSGIADLIAAFRESLFFQPLVTNPA